LIEERYLPIFGVERCKLDTNHLAWLLATVLQNIPEIYGLLQMFSTTFLEEDRVNALWHTC
jgi:hypothetical protein